MNYTIITENDISEWDDKTGVHYHFPNRYLTLLEPGTKIIYYKGKLRNKAFKNKRLLSEPHYFGCGVVGKIKAGEQKDSIASIENFQKFSSGVHFKQHGIYIEPIPENRKNNHWRYGVRQIDEKTYNKILKLSSE